MIGIKLSMTFQSAAQTTEDTFTATELAADSQCLQIAIVHGEIISSFQSFGSFVRNRCGPVRREYSTQPKGGSRRG